MDIEISLQSTYKAKYDESLFDVYVIDYGDNYHYVKQEPMSELEIEVRRLKARYRDIPSYNYALSVYYEWMEFLEEKHGGPELLKAKLKRDAVDDYVPRKPRLKNNRELKYLYKHNINLGKVGRFLVNEDCLDDFTDSVTYYTDDVDTKKITIEEGRDKDAEKIAKKMNNTISGLKSRSFESDADYLERWFRNKNDELKKKKKKGKKSKKKKHKKNSKNNGILITQLMKSNFEDYLVEDSESAPAVYDNGLLLSTGTSEEMEVYHKLNDLGWNSYKIMKRANYGKRIRQVFKKQKKKKKHKNTGYEDILIDIMTDNGFDDFEEFSREMLNMTSESVFR